MAISRRNFLGLVLGAPAIVRAENLMKIFVPSQELLVEQDILTWGNLAWKPELVSVQPLFNPTVLPTMRFGFSESLTISRGTLEVPALVTDIEKYLKDNQ